MSNIIKVVKNVNFGTLYIKPAFLFQANPLRSNAYLYEEVLLKKILATPEDRPKLLACLEPEAPLQEPTEATVPERRPELPELQEPETPPPIPPEAPARKTEPAAPLDEEGLTPIKSPMLGTFYGAPKPGAPPFVEVGQVASEDETVCIIEVMKLFNTIKAGIRGRIAKICAENAQMVEFQQTLFLLEQIPEKKASRKGKPK